MCQDIGDTYVRESSCGQGPASGGSITATNLLGALAVAFTLVVNLARGYPLIAIAGTLLVAGFLYWRWVRAGKPRGIQAIEREAEAEPND
jgi:hypothetical protein